MTCGAPLCGDHLQHNQHSGDYADLAVNVPGRARRLYGVGQMGRAARIRGGRRAFFRPLDGAAVHRRRHRQADPAARRGVFVARAPCRCGRGREAFPLYPTDELFRAVAAKPFPTISDAARRGCSVLFCRRVRRRIPPAASWNVPPSGCLPGLGDPMFDGMENRLASALFGIPAVKGVEFGAGFGASRLRGSENNDAFRVEDGQHRHGDEPCGGILGGITTGMPLTLRVGIKPTPSIGRPQKTVSLARMEEHRA